MNLPCCAASDSGWLSDAPQRPPCGEHWSLLVLAARALDAPIPSMVCTNRVSNAEVDHRGVVYLNPRFPAILKRMFGLRQRTARLVLFGVLAHELAHLELDHVRQWWRDPWQRELEADYLAGAALAARCQSFEEFAGVMNLLSGPLGSATHPPGPQRRHAIRQGWIDELYSIAG